MKPCQQQIAIALACGATWQSVPPYENNPTWTQEENDYSRRLHPKRILSFRSLVTDPYAPGMPAPLPFPDANGDAVSGIPDYLNSLDAMHDAEKVLSSLQSDDYSLRLSRNPNGSYRYKHAMFASAAQRAEHFLKTMGLWKED